MCSGKRQDLTLHFNRAMKSNMQAVLFNPKAARSLERKGLARFKDIWDKDRHEWGIDPNKWALLTPKEKEVLTRVYTDIKDDWPTSMADNAKPEIKHWDWAIVKYSEPLNTKWISIVADKWQAKGSMITSEMCRQKLGASWRSTSLVRLNLMLWRVISRKLPVRAITSKWGKGSHLCPRCHVKKETLRHAMWECPGIKPIWRRCSEILEGVGITKKITWKQALIGTKGRMNPEFHCIWQYVRAIILTRVWQDRNQVAHHKPGLNLEAASATSLIREACMLASVKRKLRRTAGIIMKKIGWVGTVPPLV